MGKIHLSNNQKNENPTMLETPWGKVNIPSIVPRKFQCGQCGKCCSGFVLSGREIDRANWYHSFLIKSPYEYPKDIGAIYNLMEKIPDAFSDDGEPIYSCKAFDREKNICNIFTEAPDIRPIACWAFPYNYDLAALFSFPYIGCLIFQQTVKWLLDGFPKALAKAYCPIRPLTLI